MTDEVVTVLVLAGWLALCSVVNIARNLARARAKRARARVEFDEAIRGINPAPVVVPRLTEREREQQAFDLWCAAERVRTERARLRAQYPTVDDRLRRAWDTSLPEPEPPAPPKPIQIDAALEEKVAFEARIAREALDIVNTIAPAVPLGPQDAFVEAGQPFAWRKPKPECPPVRTVRDGTVRFPKERR